MWSDCSVVVAYISTVFGALLFMPLGAPGGTVFGAPLLFRSELLNRNRLSLHCHAVHCNIYLSISIYVSVASRNRRLAHIAKQKMRLFHVNSIMQAAISPILRV